MNIVPKELIYIDLFSGCGGLALGMHEAGWRALFAVEKNKDAFRTLRYNLIDHNNHFCWPKWLEQKEHDIDNILTEYKEELSSLNGKILLVAGGPPCQGFSMAGRRKEDDNRNRLVKSYLDFIDLVKPESLLFENVKGFTQPFNNSKESSGKKYSDYIVTELQNRKYNVMAKMLDFSKFGIPQRRMRYILFASTTINPISFFDSLESNTKQFLKEKGLPRKVSVKNAISDLLRSNGEVECPDSKGFKSGKYGSTRTSYQKYCRKNARKGKIPDSHRFAKHKIETTQRFQQLLAMDVSDRNIAKLLMYKYGINKNCFSVLSANLPAPTLTSNPDDHIHYCEPRILTVREYARIQSFPDSYEFKGKYTTGGDNRKTDVPRYTQIGNAIPPLFGEQVGLTIKQLIRSVEPSSE